ncbi:MAG: hypothetical protein L0Z50_16880 [Verrucomicrobiales bacterium]|nr:hypothetical protein [Verrucomicrobiales bacterium]
MLTPEAANGMFRYAPSTTQVAAPNAWTTCSAAAAPAQQCVANVYALAANFGLPSTPDPVIEPLVQALAGSVNAAGVGLLAAPNLFQNSYTFTNFGVGNRWFPDFRFDWNVTTNHQFSAIYHYSLFESTPDFLNSRDFTYPVAPFNTNQASQTSNRNAFTGQWRWNMAANKSNMFIFGVVSAPVGFFNDISSAIYPQISTNIGGIRARPRIFGFSTAPWLPFGAFPRNTALGQINDTFSWTKGKHSMSFGFSATSIYGGIQSSDSAVADVRMDGFAPGDLAATRFGTTNMPGISTAQRNNARALYATLTGRIGRTLAGGNSYAGFSYVDINNRQFVTGAPLFENYRQNEYGFFGTDSWRVTPTFTFNYGLRWEYQGSPYGTDNIYFNLVGGEAGVFGVSGNGNLFAPGIQTGQKTVYQLNGNKGWYNRDLNNFAPSVGLAWNPSTDAGWYKILFGGPNKSVFRAGYNISFTREGTGNWLSMTEGNPGFFANQTAVAGQDFASGSLLFRNPINVVQQDPPAFVGTFALEDFSSNGVNSFARNLRVPYVQSWSVGIQREITPSTVVEVRYVGNHAPNLWRQLDLNETNIVENGFLQEFFAAQNNLTICQANSAQCIANQASAGVPTASRSANSFANWGLTNQTSLPIITAAFSGTTLTGPPAASGSAGSCAPPAGQPASGQCNSFFVNGSFVDLADNQVGTFATDLAFGFPDNIVLAGLPRNLFIANPDALGGAFLMTNGAQSTYNALQVEVRRRLSKGLQFNGNYTWSHSLTNQFAVSGVSFDQVDTIRDYGRDKGPSPFDIRHAFKLQAIWELPFGPGRRWSSEHGWMNRFIEGWEISALARWQSGRVAQLQGNFFGIGDLGVNGGTFNFSDGGVELIGITAKQLQKMAKVRKVPGDVFYFPDNVLNGSVIRPCQTPGQFCQRVFIYGPSFLKPDINVVKRTHITERVNIEVRAEFLNAFNTINFLYGGTEAAGAASDNVVPNAGATFGRITNAFRDVSTTDDPGGRSIQLVLRVNF